MGELLSVFCHLFGADWSRDIDNVLYESITCKWGVEIIAVTSWHHCISYHRQLGQSGKKTFIPTTKRTPVSVTVPLWGESTGDRSITLKVPVIRETFHDIIMICLLSQARHAQAAGADAVACMCPFYFKPPTTGKFRQLTHWGRVTHTCVSKLTNHHCFR